MIDLRRFLLENIRWYKPAAYQKILLSTRHLHDLHQYLPYATEHDDEHLYGIRIEMIADGNPPQVVFSIPDDLDCSERLPIPNKYVYTEVRLGLIGSTLEKIVRSCKGKFQRNGNVSKERVLEKCVDYYNLILDYHRPTRTIGRLSWGFELAFLYAAAHKNIPCLGLIVDTRKFNPPQNWDITSRMMYAYLTENNADVKLTYHDTIHKCRLQIISNCDVCMFQNATVKLSDQMSFTKKTVQSRNKLVLDVTNDWLQYIEPW